MHRGEGFGVAIVIGVDKAIGQLSDCALLRRGLMRQLLPLGKYKHTSQACGNPARAGHPHEKRALAKHKVGLQKRILAPGDLLANTLCEWPLMSNLSGYRAFHFEHHRKVGTPDDPELIHKNNEWRILNIPVLGQWPVPIRPWKFALFIAGDFFGAALQFFGLSRSERFFGRSSGSASGPST
jgi:Fatty acid desaturase